MPVSHAGHAMSAAAADGHHYIQFAFFDACRFAAHYTILRTYLKASRTRSQEALFTLSAATANANDDAFYMLVSLSLISLAADTYCHFRICVDSWLMACMLRLMAITLGHSFEALLACHLPLSEQQLPHT